MKNDEWFSDILFKNKTTYLFSTKDTFGKYYVHFILLCGSSKHAKSFSLENGHFMYIQLSIDYILTRPKKKNYLLKKSRVMTES